jgi:hypothetical protein
MPEEMLPTPEARRPQTKVAKATHQVFSESLPWTQCDIRANLLKIQVRAKYPKIYWKVYRRQ